MSPESPSHRRCCSSARCGLSTAAQSSVCPSLPRTRSQVGRAAGWETSLRRMIGKLFRLYSRHARSPAEPTIIRVNDIQIDRRSGTAVNDSKQVSEVTCKDSVRHICVLPHPDRLRHTLYELSWRIKDRDMSMYSTCFSRYLCQPLQWNPSDASICYSTRACVQEQLNFTSTILCCD